MREPNLADRYQRPYRVPAPALAKSVHALDAAPRSRRPPRKVTRGSRPNAGIEATYRERLTALVEDMHKSVLWWMRAAYREHEPVMAEMANDGRRLDDSDIDAGDSYFDFGNSHIGQHAALNPEIANDGCADVCVDSSRGLLSSGDDIHHLLEDGMKDDFNRLMGLDGDLPSHGRLRARGFVGDEPEAGIMLLQKARQYDREGYSFGLRHIRIRPDRSKWHSFYDPSKDEITTEAKFWGASAFERLHMLLHEIGHRGQGVDRPAYEAFKREHLNTMRSFRLMANPVHLRDARAGHLHDIAEEVWAESYARWCLGLPMPDELKEFWDDRLRGSLRARDGGFHPSGGIHSATELRESWDGRASSEYRYCHTGDSADRPGDSGADGMAFDRTPADHLRGAFARLRKRWEERFDVAAGKLARWFAQSTARRSDEQLRRILKDGGLSVRFTPTPAMRDVMAGSVNENVALIKSIPQQYLTQVEGAVMRSVQTGRDLAQLTKDLQHEFGVTKRRAKFIALDQNNKATAAMTRARQVELGMQAIWVHSHAGREPRKTHLANDGQTYDPSRGWFDPDPKVRRWVWPGELSRCRCISRTVIPGFKP